jgi:hypothetical protein
MLEMLRRMTAGEMPHDQSGIDQARLEEYAMPPPVLMPFHARFTVRPYRRDTARKARGVAPSVLGIHHVTAIAGNPQQNIDFCTQDFGRRLVKVTVDLHDLETYQLCYGTRAGRRELERWLPPLLLQGTMR